jgi:hypothetical protein
MLLSHLKHANSEVWEANCQQGQEFLELKILHTVHLARTIAPGLAVQCSKIIHVFVLILHAPCQGQKGERALGFFVGIIGPMCLL